MNEPYDKNNNHNRGHNSVSITSSWTPLCRFLMFILIAVLLVNDKSSVVKPLLQYRPQQPQQRPYRCATATCCRSLLQKHLFYKYSRVNNDDRTGAWLIPAPKQCSVNHFGDTTALYMSSSHDGDSRAGDVVIDNSRKVGVVWCDISQIAGVEKTFSDVTVQAGESISSIKRKIKDSSAAMFQNIDAPLIKLYEFADSTDPLEDGTEWTTNVAWGTYTTKLFAKLSVSKGTISFC
jgi:hypothetical protein